VNDFVNDNKDLLPRKSYHNPTVTAPSSHEVFDFKVNHAEINSTPEQSEDIMPS
jgi:hypothetical protein